MKDNPCKYRFFTKVDETTPLGKLFNKVFGVLKIPRGISAPETTTEDGWNNIGQALMFYELCLMEQYLHSIIHNLSEWQTLTKKYAGEFHYSWKYFALSNKMDLIKEYGGEDYDYNEDGSIRTDFCDEQLINETIVAELSDTHTKSIFHTTTPLNYLTMCNMIVYLGANCIIDFLKKSSGKPIKTYRKGDDDELIENDWMDEAMQKAANELAHEDLATIFWSALLAVYALVLQVKDLPKTEDNKEFFMSLPKKIDNIFQLRIQPLKLPKIETTEDELFQFS